MRILVTGSAGLIGSWIARELMTLQHDVLCIDNLSCGLESNIPLQKFALLDLESPEAYAKIREFAPEAVFHCAANAREGASHFQPLAVTRANTFITISTLEAAILGGSLKKFIYFSSIATYGGHTQPPFDETLPVKPVDVYGAAKVFCETAIPILADIHNFKYTIFKPHNVYGPHQVYHDPYRNVVAIFLHRVLRGEPLYVYGSGEQRRAFSYVEDALPCYVRSLTEADGEIVNIGGRQPYTVNGLVDIVRRVTKKSVEVIHTPVRAHEVVDAWSTNDKSELLLGYEDKTPLMNGVAVQYGWMERLGPRPWSVDDLPLINEKAPAPWLNFDAARRSPSGS